MIELMIVIAIMGMILATGIPAMFRTMQKDNLRQAVSDIVEGCSHARAYAILRGAPTEFVIKADGGAMSIQPARMREGDTPQLRQLGSGKPSADATASGNFKARLDDDVAVKLLYLNFQDQMEKPETRVRFYPNGTCDEFSIIIFSEHGERLISTDTITGHAKVEVVR